MFLFFLRLWHFHGNCPVRGPINRSAWEWSRERKSRTPNTVSGAEREALMCPCNLWRFLTTGQEMETMTAGGGEGVDLTGLLQGWRQPHPPLSGCFPAVTRWLELFSFCFIWSHPVNEGSRLGMFLLGCSSWNSRVNPKVPTPWELFDHGVWLEPPLQTGRWKTKSRSLFIQTRHLLISTYSIGSVLGLLLRQAGHRGLHSESLFLPHKPFGVL